MSVLGGFRAHRGAPAAIPPRRPAPRPPPPGPPSAAAAAGAAAAAIGLKIASSLPLPSLGPGSRRRPAPGPAARRLHRPRRAARQGGRAAGSEGGREGREGRRMQRAALFRGGDAQMAAGDLGELLVPYMPTIRVPKSGDRVYKTECAFSYDSPVSAASHPRLPPRPRPPRPLPLPAAPRTLPGPLPPLRLQSPEPPLHLPRAWPCGSPRAPHIAAGSFLLSLVYFPPPGRSEVVAWTRGFCGFGETPLLALVVGVCLLHPEPAFALAPR